MQKVDADTIASGVPGIELMERAGRGVADTILRYFQMIAEGRAAIVVGPGNNGGDGLVVARRLVEAGWSCSIHMLKPVSGCSPDTAANYTRLAGMPRIAEFDANAPGWRERAADDFIRATVIVDAIFGTGFSGVPRGSAATAISLLKEIRDEYATPLFAVDVPSGVNATTGEVAGEAVRGTLTVTIGAVKTGLVFHPGRAYTGALDVLDIGFPPDIIEKHSDRVFYLDHRAAAAKLPPRAPDMHKYKAGVVLVIAGSERYRGAALLTAEAALRAGCGMLFLAVPESIHREIPVSLREAIVLPMPQTNQGTMGRNAATVLSAHIEKADVVAIGPGLDRHDETDAFVRELVTSCTKPLVVDADALNALAGYAQNLQNAKAPVVITPHDGELARLTGKRSPADAVKRLAYSAETARALGVTLVHKGAPTLIASRDGAVWINSSGNSALAKGGTGDVLTGMIAGFLAQTAAAGVQSPQPVDSACVACFLHGRAGEIEARSRGERGVMASDLFAAFGQAMTELENPAFRQS